MKNLTVLFAFISILAFSAPQAMACSVNCTNGSCSGLYSCTCDASGNPVCKDKPIIIIENLMGLKNTEEDLLWLSEYIDHLKENKSLADLSVAAEALYQALVSDNLGLYVEATESIRNGFQKLTLEQLDVHNSWSGFEPAEPLVPTVLQEIQH